MSLTCAGPTQAQDLPLEIQADLLWTAAKGQIGASEWKKAVVSLEKFKTLGTPLPGDFAFQYGRALLGSENFASAQKQLTLYLREAGREGSHYQEALRLYLESREKAVAFFRQSIEIPKLKMKMLPIPAGSFMMGSPEDEPGRDADEGLHQVTITRPFWMGKHEVTQGQWKEVMGVSLADYVKGLMDDDTLYRFRDVRQTFRAFRGGLQDGKEEPQKLLGNEADDLPMYYVSWRDAMEFCRKLNGREEAAGRLPKGYVYTLPTEAQWEYACRSGSSNALYSGPIEILGRNNAPSLDPIAWYGGNSGRDYKGAGWMLLAYRGTQHPMFAGFGGPRRVGQKRANGYGLHDMLGNLWEWCSDNYAHYPQRAVSDPVGGGRRVAFPVIRGGGWHMDARHCRSAERHARAEDYRGNQQGFRLCLNFDAANQLTKPSLAGKQRQVTGRPLRKRAKTLPEQEIELRELGIEMLPVPAGSFMMGSPVDEPGRRDWEVLHRVSIGRSFWMGKYEVTQGQWQAVMGGTLADQVRKCLDDDTLFRLGGKKQTFRGHWGVARDTDPKLLMGNEADDYPMYYVSWREALEFCKKLTRREEIAGRLPDGFEYTLPTEAQWEYACRSGSSNAVYSGGIKILAPNNVPALDPIAWYGGNSSQGFKGRGVNTESWKGKQFPGGSAGARRVGQKWGNRFGLHDMLGNVVEWCSDSFGEYKVGLDTETRLPGPGLPAVMRGGSWNKNGTACRSAARAAHWPYYRSRDLGFRLCLSRKRQKSE